MCIRDSIKPEFKELVGGDVQLAKMRKEIGPMTFDEKKLLCISIGLLALWATGGKLHSIDTTTTTIIAIALFFFPKIGIMDWKFAQPNIDVYKRQSYYLPNYFQLVDVVIHRP